MRGELQIFIKQELSEIGEHGHPFRDNIFVDVCSLALLTFEVSVPDELQHGGSHGNPADAEHLAEFFLGRNLRAERPFTALDLPLQDFIEL